MKFNTLPGTSVAVSDLCLGSMYWGEKNSENEAHAQLDRATDRGINFVDTAEIYPSPTKPQSQGRSETYLGTWLKRQKREHWVIATKVAGPGIDYLLRAGRTNLCRENVERAVEDSLRR